MTDEIANLRAKLAAAEAVLAPIAPVLEELQRALAKFPTWPTDPLHAMGVVHEEVGELAKEVLQFVYEPDKSSTEAIRKEAVQAAAMLLRFFVSLDTYEYVRRPLHPQPALQNRETL